MREFCKASLRLCEFSLRSATSWVHSDRAGLTPATVGSVITMRLRSMMYSESASLEMGYKHPQSECIQVPRAARFMIGTWRTCWQVYQPIPCAPEGSRTSPYGTEIYSCLTILYVRSGLDCVGIYLESPGDIQIGRKRAFASFLRRSQENGERPLSSAMCPVTRSEARSTTLPDSNRGKL
jgi:hypothetical protein